MRNPAERRGISRVVIPIAIIVVLVVAAAVIFLGRGSPNTSSTSSSAASLPNVPVDSYVTQIIQDLNSRNVDALMNLYNPNAVSVWSGATGGLSGQYAGTNSIRLIYATTVGKDTSINANVSSLADKTISPTETNTTFVIKLVANSTAAGIVKATILATEQWNWGGSGWQITKENWAYRNFDSSFIDAGLGSATTFPQWGYELKGGNPNLVPDKSFEWHAGPYVAASVYAFLAGIVCVFALKSRSRTKGADWGGSGAKVPARSLTVRGSPASD